jgi:hypothetical protein
LSPRHSRAFSSPYPVLEDVTIQWALNGDKDIKMLLKFCPGKFCSNLSDKMIACCSTQTSTSLQGWIEDDRCYLTMKETSAPDIWKLCVFRSTAICNLNCG